DGPFPSTCGNSCIPHVRIDRWPRPYRIRRSLPDNLPESLQREDPHTIGAQRQLAPRKYYGPSPNSHTCWLHIGRSLPTHTRVRGYGRPCEAATSDRSTPASVLVLLPEYAPPSNRRRYIAYGGPAFFRKNRCPNC